MGTCITPCIHARGSIMDDTEIEPYSAPACGIGLKLENIYGHCSHGCCKVSLKLKLKQKSRNGWNHKLRNFALGHPPVMTAFN